MIAENIKNLRATINDFKKNSSFKNDVELVAVTKTRTIEEIQEAIDCGIKTIAENKVQEAQKKFSQINRNVKWHLIGHLQTNKVKIAVKIFDVIESVDSIKVAKITDEEARKIGKIQRIYLQVNLTHEPQKFGIFPEELYNLIDEIKKLPNLHLEGLMFIAPNLENQSQLCDIFKKMRLLYEDTIKYLGNNNSIKNLSMGMSGDYKIAIKEGSSAIRLGTAIFGPRNY